MERYGLTEKKLEEAFLSTEYRDHTAWSLSEIPIVGFYRKLHHYLKSWPLSRSATKTMIGKFYISIDPELQTKSICTRPDNVYQFIERVASSKKPCSTPMSYGLRVTIQHLKDKVKGCSTEVHELTTKVCEQEEELSAMRKEVEIANQELSETKYTLDNITHRLQVVQKQRDCAHHQVKKSKKRLDATEADFVHYEQELLEENEELHKLIGSLRNQTELLSKTEVSLQTKEKGIGNMYTPAVRELCYSLLADQMPPAKVATTIQAVLKCFIPSLDLRTIKLPSEGCASYMRRQELTTVSMVHKAVAITEQSQLGSLHLNSDGTTKSQKKLEGVAINGMVVSVNEVPDGRADSIIDDISKELERLREIAHVLNLPEADKINWTLIVSSTSDSAATQKRFNKLLHDKREEDEKRFGPVSQNATDLIENFCYMHLGVNLRKAFLKGAKSFTNSDSNDTETREQHQVDTLVHEFCKLFGKHGVPEYGCGTLAFPDFLELKMPESISSDHEMVSYYQLCLKVSLERQVGSRYFVTACNAGKVLFLKEAALDFLLYTGKDTGNKLEQDVFRKLQDPQELAQLKADALMFHHVYADLAMLAKSTDLNKSSFDMNQHNLELQQFLQNVQLNPHVINDKELKVFISEERLYGDEKSVNHRIHSKYKPVEERLFKEDEWDEGILFPLLAAGASEMNNKLTTYAINQLPGGKYWNPEPAVEATLKLLKPNNDLCESILGLNDYLTTTIPNLHQLTRSNMIQVKKNKTMQWFHKLPQAEQQTIVRLAVKKRGEVMKAYKEEEIKRKKERQDKMIREKQRREALKQRAIKEREKLSKLHLITSPHELRRALSEIDNEDISVSKKNRKKLAIMREQINIRKKLLNQKIDVPFSHHRKQRPLCDIILELSNFIAKYMTPSATAGNESVVDPASLVGRRICHKFDVDGQDEWYDGHVIGYDVITHLHEIVYDGEKEHCYFNLLEDISQGDLSIY